MQLLSCPQELSRVSKNKNHFSFGYQCSIPTLSTLAKASPSSRNLAARLIHPHIVAVRVWSHPLLNSLLLQTPCLPHNFIVTSSANLHCQHVNSSVKYHGRCLASMCCLRMVTVCPQMGQFFLPTFGVFQGFFSANGPSTWTILVSPALSTTSGVCLRVTGTPYGAICPRCQGHNPPWGWWLWLGWFSVTTSLWSRLFSPRESVNLSWRWWWHVSWLMSSPTTWWSSPLCCKMLSILVYWSPLNVPRSPSTVSPGFRVFRSDCPLSSAHLPIWLPSWWWLPSSHEVPPSMKISTTLIVPPVHSTGPLSMTIIMPSCPSWGMRVPPNFCGTIFPPTIITWMHSWIWNLAAQAPILPSVGPTLSSPHGSLSQDTHTPILILLSFWDEPGVSTLSFLLTSHMWDYKKTKQKKQPLCTIYPQFPDHTASPWDSWLWVVQVLHT